MLQQDTITNTQQLYIESIFESFICAFISNLFVSLSEHAVIPFLFNCGTFGSPYTAAAGGALNAASAVCGAEMQIMVCCSNHQSVKYVVISVYFLFQFYV